MHLVLFILTNLLSSSILLAETAIVLSSGKSHNDLLLIISKMSFIKILKKSGPRIYSCGALA